ncbi:hypothetical protein [Actinoplanes italicus]|uniref:hypothetical protein n=1 Tax=Actinoplanes italicus TaxID=113567 RepID=UPI000D054870|nr:hypothetical protein [Actinoplanes italicus]
MDLGGYQNFFEGDPDLDVAALLTDGRHLLDKPGFWAAYLRALMIPDEDYVLAAIWNTAADDDLDDFIDPGRWEVLRVGLGGGAEIAVVFRNLDEDDGVDYLVLPGGGAEAIPIAAIDGHQTGPGLSWPELAGVAARQEDPVRRAQALLLLAPAFGDAAADNPEAIALVSGAMRVLGATGDVEAAASMLVSDEVDFWGHVEWDAGVPDSDLAPRNPGSYFALVEAERLQVIQLLTP